MSKVYIDGKTIQVRDQKNRLTPMTTFMLIVLSLWVISFLTLLLWSFKTCFQTASELLPSANALALPKKFVWNFPAVMQQFNVTVTKHGGGGTLVVRFPMLIINSLVYALGCALINTGVHVITAYACAKFHYKYSRIVHTIVVITMILPIVGSGAAEVFITQVLNIYDTFIGMFIMRANFLGMYFLVLYSMFKALPDGYSEAAKVDGAGNLTIMLRIVFPLVRNTIFTILLLEFIGYWNDYQTPYLYLPSHPTVSLGLYNLSTMGGVVMTTIPMRMTAAMIVFVPIFIIFLLFQKRLLGNLTMGGLKG